MLHNGTVELDEDVSMNIVLYAYFEDILIHGGYVQGSYFIIVRGTVNAFEYLMPPPAPPMHFSFFFDDINSKQTTCS